MRLKSLLIAGAVAFSSTQVNAQAWVDDSVTMGQGYANDVFYSLKNGAQPAVSNMNWHLAFQMTPPGPYGNVSILANHVQGGVKVYSLHMRAATNLPHLRQQTQWVKPALRVSSSTRIRAGTMAHSTG